MKEFKSVPHNPDYKLVSVIIGGRELVYGETNTGANQGLEVYFLGGANGHYYSRRFKEDKIPMIYNGLFKNLKSVVDNCLPGHKISLSGEEYRIVAKERI